MEIKLQNINLWIEKEVLRELMNTWKFEHFDKDEFITPYAKEFLKIMQKFHWNETEILGYYTWKENEDYAIDIISNMSSRTDLHLLIRDLREEKWKFTVEEIKAKALVETDTEKIKELLESIPPFPQEVEDMTFEQVVEEVVLWIAGEWKPIKKIPTGYSKLDTKLDWWYYPWTLNIIAWKPWTWKSAFALSFFNNQIFNWKFYGVYFSLEMWRKEVLQRIFSNQSWVEFSKIRSWEWIDNFERINKVLENIQASKLDIIDNLFKFEQICNKIRELKKEWLDVVFIDYLGLMETKADNKYQEISIMTRRLKELSRECDIPIIVLAQLNRNDNNRWDKSPKLSDLRDSGSIEQDADSVIMLCRPDEETNELDVRIRKNRNWPSDICLEYQSKYEVMQVIEDN